MFTLLRSLSLSDCFCSPSPDKPNESADRLLQERFRKLGLFPEAFSSVQYRGTRTYNPPTDFSGLLRSLEQQLDNNTTRSPRSASVIYKALQVAMLDYTKCVLPDILLFVRFLAYCEHY